MAATLQISDTYTICCGGGFLVYTARAAGPKGMFSAGGIAMLNFDEVYIRFCFHSNMVYGSYNLYLFKQWFGYIIILLQ